MDELAGIVAGLVLPWLIVAEGVGVAVPWGEFWGALGGFGFGWTMAGAR